jgi:formylglycine-generating enzyme required for sulfatase activity
MKQIVNRLRVYVFSLWLMLSLLSASGQTATFTNGIGMEFILVHPGVMVVGKFQPPYPIPDDTIKSARHVMIMNMGEGRPYNDSEFRLAKTMATRDAMPGFEVRIDHTFYIGKFEVTQEQWQRVIGSNPSVFNDKGVADAAHHPVESVSWVDIQTFISKINEMEGDKKYRLPTEFEWEYAARAGSKGDIPWSEIQLAAVLGTTSTQVVGQKKPNSLGLYDMLGNVWEWVDDLYNGKIFADPQPPAQGNEHVLKGASFVGDVKNATYLTHAAGPGNGWDVGFRLVMEVTKK